MKLLRHLLYSALLLCLYLPATLAMATSHSPDFVPLVPIPGLTGSNLDPERYLEIIYIFAIVAAALLAVIKLILAGFTYVTSSLIDKKTDAKNDIFNAIIGLLIIMAAVVILRTINPDIANLPVLSGIDIPDTGPRVEVVRDPLGREITIPEGGTTYAMGCDALPGPGGGPYECESAVERCQCTPGYEGHTIDARRVLCELNTSRELSESCGEASVEAGGDIDPPPDYPAGAEAFMVDGRIYFTASDSDRLTSLYCEVDNDLCNDYCFENDGVMDESTGICEVELEPLEVRVSNPGDQ